MRLAPERSRLIVGCHWDRRWLVDTDLGAYSQRGGPEAAPSCSASQTEMGD